MRKREVKNTGPLHTEGVLRVHPPGLERYPGSPKRTELANSAEIQFHIVHKFQVVLPAWTIYVQSS
jgi:hypothetical protein